MRFIRRFLGGLFLVAVTAVDATGTVLVVGEGDCLDVADVELLRRVGDYVLVRAHGLAGRAIVSERSPMLGAGSPIRPIRPGAGEAPAEPGLVEVDPERRVHLATFVEGNQFLPKARVFAQVKEDKVPNLACRGHLENLAATFMRAEPCGLRFRRCCALRRQKLMHAFRETQRGCVIHLRHVTMEIRRHVPPVPSSNASDSARSTEAQRPFQDAANKVC